MMANKKSKQSVSPWAIVALIGAVSVVALAVVLLSKPTKDIDNFQSCKDAGGAILESYPERCVLNGKSFTNDAQSVNNGANEYIGLTEQAALDKARSENKPARVVERDGEALAVTLDYMPGRLNFSVKDGKVYYVHVEGEDSR